MKPIVVLHGGRPYWRFDVRRVPARKWGGHGLVDVPLGAGLDALFNSAPVGAIFHLFPARLGVRPHKGDLRRVRSWLKKHQAWSRHLLGLPIDWARPLYIRYGAWSGPSRTFLREDIEEPALYLPGSQHERRGELGVSVLDVTPTGGGWKPQRPSQRHALYRLPDDYLRSFRGRVGYIVQGDRIPVGEHYDEITDETYPVYATGADGEPLLETDSIQVIEELAPRRRRRGRGARKWCPAEMTAARLWSQVPPGPRVTRKQARDWLEWKAKKRGGTPTDIFGVFDLPDENILAVYVPASIRRSLSWEEAKAVSTEASIAATGRRREP